MTSPAANPATPAAQDRGDVQARLIACGDLDTDRIREMFRLYAANYADTSDDIFRRDLARKTHALLLTRADDSLCGFTTLELYSSTAAGEPVRVVFSGDTIIDPAHWGSSALAVEWLRFAGTVARHETSPLYWLLIVKGHRTYRFLPAFAKHYIPHHEFPDSPSDRALLSALAREKFGSQFDSASGVVHFATPQGRLVDELADVPSRHSRLRPVAHFLRLNPGYRQGDELVCLCRLSAQNLRPFAARVFAADSGLPH